ncbi:MAG TPA: hypothetical protein VEZ16_05520 [Microvirga sp.]|nr:hypothetical protein [Microvirga sp.]
MRCYFNFFAGDDMLIDEVGVEVSSLDHAHSQALQAIQEMSQGAEGQGVDWADWTLNVTDGTGQVLLTVALDGVVARETSFLH